MFTAGATWYPDTEKEWAVSLLNRYEINQRERDVDFTIGNIYTLEWAVSREVTKTVQAAAVGYYQAQVTNNSGAGNEPYGRVAAVGPEVEVAFPKYMLNCSFRYVYEFYAETVCKGTRSP